MKAFGIGQQINFDSKEISENNKTKEIEDEIIKEIEKMPQLPLKRVKERTKSCSNFIFK